MRQSPQREQLIYTRRIGARRDDGMGASNIDAAVKVSGSYAGLDLGVFAVQERDPDTIGRSASALRIKRPGELFDVGYLGSYVERPFLHRFAAVNALDFQFARGPWLWNTTLLASQITFPIASPADAFTVPGDVQKNGTGGFSTLSYRPSNTFDMRADLIRYGKSLDYNDLGFQRRSDFSYYELAPRWLQNSYPDGHWLRSSAFGLDFNMTENSGGRNLSEEYEASVDLSYKDGSRSYFEARYRPAGIDDLVSRGNGALRFKSGATLFGNYESVRRGNFSGFVGLYFDNAGLRGRQSFIETGARYWIGDGFNARFGVEATAFRGRTLWRGGNLFGVFDQSDTVAPNIQLEWFQGSQHELRVKTQLLAVRGNNATAYRLQANERLRASPTDSVSDFAVNSFGFQMRYRYKINQESDIFLVYSRGGEVELERGDDGLADLLSDSLELRDADQFLLKLRYAF